MPDTKYFTQSQFDKYQSSLKSSGLSRSSIRRKLSSLYSFQKYLVKQGLISKDAARTQHAKLKGLANPQIFSFNFKNPFQSPNFIKYTTIATIAILFVGLGLGLYSQTILKAKKNLAYSTAASPVRPGRQLSFQGRLTDSATDPITSSTPIVFKLYTSETGGTMVYTSSIGNSQTVTPDQNGIFSVIIGKTHGLEIDPTVFSNYSEIWLEITAGGETMTPRQQIATVSYALNSETLQGLPPSASGWKNTVLVLDGQGNLNLGETSPTIKSTSGTLAVEGQALLLKASDGSGGNIEINPDASGVIKLTTEGAAPGIGGGFISATNANLSSGNLFNGQINNNNYGYNFLDFENYAVGSTTLTSRFSISALGNVNVGATLNSSNISIGNTVVTSSAQELNLLHGTLATSGSLIYGNGSNLTNLAIGASGQALISTGAAPVWVDPGSLGKTYTSNNGIGLSGTNFQLGGSLIQNTRLNIGNTEVMFFNFANGNIGLGLTNPQAVLDIIASGNQALKVSGGYIDLPTATPLSNVIINNDLIALFPFQSTLQSSRNHYGNLTRTDTTSGYTSTYMTESGYLYSDGDNLNNNTPRFQKTPTGRGVWVENGRQNRLSYASFEDSSSVLTGWTAVGLDSTAVSSTFLKHRSYSAMLGDTGGGGQIYRTQPGLAIGQTYPVFCYALNVGNTRAVIDGGVAQLYANGSVLPTTYTEDTGGWYKLSGKAVAVGSTSINFGIDVKANQKIVIDGCQLESDYNSTNGVPYSSTLIYNDSTNQRNRGEETLYVYAGRGSLDSSGADVILNPAKGTVSMWFVPEWASNEPTTDLYFFQIPNVIQTFYQASTDSIVTQMYNGVNWTTVSATSAPQNFNAYTNHHLAVKWDNTSGISLSIDGVITTTPVTWTAQQNQLNTSSYLYIGSKSTAGGRLDSLVSDFATFRSQLSDATLKQIFVSKTPIQDYQRNDLVTLQTNARTFQVGNIRITGELYGGSVNTSTVTTSYLSSSYIGTNNSANLTSHVVLHLPFQNNTLDGSRQEIGTFLRSDTNPASATAGDETSLKLINKNANEPRIDRGFISNSVNADSSLNTGNFGIHIEEARKNIALNSSFENGAVGWTNGIGITASVTTTRTIHGNNALNLSSTAMDRYYQTIDLSSVAVGTTHQVSVYAYRNEASAWGGTIDTTILNLYASATGATTPLTTTYTSLGNGWYRLTGQFSSTAASWTIGVQFPSSGRNVFIDAFQVERSDTDATEFFPTSYIPSTTSPLTRASEQLTYSLPSGFKSTKGGFSVWFKPDWGRLATGDATDKYLFYIPNVMRVKYNIGSSYFAVEQYNTAVGATGWVATVTTGSNTVNQYTWNHLACGWYYNYNYCRLNGNAASSGTGWTPQPDTSNKTLYLGSSDTGTNQINAQLAAFTLFDEFLDGTQQNQLYLNRGKFEDYYRTDQAKLVANGSVSTQTGSLYLTGNFRAGNGTAAAPAFSFNSDNHTGLFAPLANTLAMSVGGTESFRINSNGSISIGNTTSNGYQLNVTGSAYFSNNLTVGGTFVSVGSTNTVTNLSADLLDGLHSSAFLQVGNTGSFITSITGGTDISVSGAGVGRTINDTSTFATVTGRGASTNSLLSLLGGAYFGSTSQSLLKANGTVGIGTTNPLYKLHVTGTIGATDVQLTGTPTSDSSAITRAYSLSKGMNLVVNGSGLMGNNYNFTGFTFDQTDVHGGKGSFKNSTYNVDVKSDELIPIDGSRTYKMSVWAKSTVHSVGSHAYIGVAPYDIDGNVVGSSNYQRVANTDTYLAQAISVGDSVVHLVNGANWKNGADPTYQHQIIFWNYSNSFGYTYPEYTYSRNLTPNYATYNTNGAWLAGSVVGNDITLSAPWPASLGSVPAGTPVSNGSQGSGYKYLAAGNVDIPAAWTNYTGTIGTWDTTGANVANKFPYGTAYVKLLFLLNRDVAGNTTNFSDLWFSELTAANIETANGLNNLSGSIGLGGTLSQSTNINLSSYNLSFLGSATQSLFLKSNGNVGIGNTNPTSKLTVTGDANISTNLTIGGTFLSVGSSNLTTNLNADYLNGLHASAFVGVGQTANFITSLTGGTDISVSGAGIGRTINDTSTLATVTGRGASTNTLLSLLGGAYFGTAGATQGVWQANGTVGIGTTAPLQKLHVSGSAQFGTQIANTAVIINDISNAGSPQISMSDNIGGDNFWAIGADDADNFFKIAGVAGGSMPVINNIGTTIGTNNLRLYVDLNNNLTTGGIRVANGNVSSPAYSFTSDTNTGMYHIGADTLSLATAGLDRITILASGAVGIGTTAPGQKLDVAGNVSASTYYGTNFYDTNNQSYFLDPSAATSLTTAGSVGIGNTTPGAYKLNVTGDGYFSGNLTIGGTYFGNGSGLTNITASALSFSGITSGTNTTANMVVGTGASLSYTGTGVINASQLQGIGASGFVGVGQTGNFITDVTGGTDISISGSGVGRTINDTSTLTTVTGRGASTSTMLSLNGGAYLPGGIWDATGKVGIGTTNPTYKLDVSGDIRTSTKLINYGIGSSNGVWFNWGTSAYANLYGSSSADRYIYLGATDGGTASLNINNGSLSVGGTNAAYKLNIIGSGYLSNNLTIGGTYFGNGSGLSNVTATSVSFAGITSGTNAIANMVVDTGASISYTGTGVINASQLQGIGASGFVGVGQTGNFITNLTGGTDISITGSGVGRTINDTSTLATITGRGASTSTTLSLLGGAYFGAAGANQGIWDASGNIGINTTAPGSKLQLSRNTYATENGIKFQTSTGYDSKIYQPASSDDLRIWGQNIGDIATFKNSGNVGIGTTNPLSKLSIDGTNTGTAYNDGSVQIVGSSPLAFTSAANLNSSLNRWGFKLRQMNEGDFSIFDYRSSVDRLLIDSSGKVGIGTTVPIFKLHVAEGNIFTSNHANDTGLYMSSSAGTFGLIQAVNENNTLTNNLVLQLYGGSVSIGNNAPGAYKLNVTGSGYFSNNLQIGGTFIGDGSGLTGVTAATVPFSGVTSGINQNQNLVIGNGSTLSATGDGVINATLLQGIGASGFVGVGQTVNFITTLTAGTDISVSGAGIGRTINDTSTLATVTGRGSSTNTLISLTGGAYFGAAGSGIIKANGSVGVGTTNPIAKLTVVGNGSISTSLSVGTSLTVAGNLSVGGTFLSVGSTNTVTNLSANYLQGIPATGFIGVGQTANFITTLTAGTDISITGAGIGRTINDTSTLATVTGRGSSTNTLLSLNGGAYFGSTSQSLLKSDGSIGIGTTNPSKTLEINGDSLLSGSARTLQISNSGTAFLNFSNVNNAISYSGNQFGFSTTQTQGFTFSGGNVGIGITNPGAYKLNVAGDGYFSNNLTIGGTFISVGSTNTVTNLSANYLQGIPATGFIGVGQTANFITSLTGGTDISITGAGVGRTINDTSTLATVTGRGASTATTLSLTGGAYFGSTSQSILKSNGSVGIGTTAFDGANPEKLLVDAGNTTSVNGAVIKGSINNYFQLNLSNKSVGNSASSDIVATADNGNEAINYIDLGINGSNYAAGVVGNANDAYLYSTGNNLVVGNATVGKDIVFFTNGTNSYTNERMRISSGGGVSIGNTTPGAYKLNVTGNGYFSGNLQIGGTYIGDGSGLTGIVAASVPFSGVTGSTNTNQNLVVGNGSTLSATGTGVINATLLQGIAASGFVGVGQTANFITGITAGTDISITGSGIGRTINDTSTLSTITGRGATTNTLISLLGGAYFGATGANQGIWQSNGSIGIGTTLATSKLTVVGDANISTNLTIGGTFVSVGSTNVVTNLNADYLDGLNAAAFIQVGSTGNFITNLTGGTDISITGAGVGRTINDTSTLATVTGRGATTNTLISLTGGAYFGSTSQSILKSNGSVGIGTTNPISILNIFSNLDTNGTDPDTFTGGLSIINGTGSTNVYTGIRMGFNNAGVYGGDNWYLNTLAKANNNLDLLFGHKYSSEASFNELMRLNSSGYLGIGTTNPTSKLTVVGDANISTNLSIGGTFLSVGSTNIVTNLDADYLDGLSASAFLQVGSSGSFISSLTGGTDISVSGSGIGRTINDTSTLATVTGRGASTASYLSFTSGAYLGSIGATNPGALLTINTTGYGLPVTSGTTQTYANMRLQSSGGNVVLDFGDAGSTGTWLQTTLKTDLSQVYPLLFQPNGGNVGIGTTNATSKLTVVGDANISTNLSIGGTFLSVGSTNIVTNLDADYLDGLHASAFIQIGSTGNFITNLSGGTDISVSGAGIGRTINDTSTLATVTGRGSSTNTLISLTGGAYFGAAGSGIIKANGSVGVGTTNPIAKLTVVGNGSISTSLSVGTSLTVAGNLSVGGTFLSVGSTNIVTNLDADYLDGLHASAFIQVGSSGAFITTLTGGTDVSITGAGIGRTINDTSTLATVTGRGATTNTQLTLTGGALFGTAGSTQGILKANGTVGIGTTNPTSLLQLMGSNSIFKIGDTAGNTLFEITDANITSNLPTNFTSSGDVSVAYDLNFTNSSNSNINTAGPFSINAGEVFNSSNLTLKTYNAGKIILDSSNLWTDGNNFGLGTTNPTSKLTVIGDANISTNLLVGGTFVSVGSTNTVTNLSANYLQGIPASAFIQVGSTGSFISSLTGGTDISITGAGVGRTINDTSTLATVTGRGASTATTLSLTGGAYFGSTSQSLLKSDGSIGIGTTNPGNKLTVIGDANISTSLAVGTSLTVASNLSVGGTSYFGSLVGLGTTSPAARLQIDEQSVNDALIIRDAFMNNIALRISGAGIISQYNSGTGVLTNSLKASGNSFITGGNFGIGTTNPISIAQISFSDTNPTTPVNGLTILNYGAATGNFAGIKLSTYGGVDGGNYAKQFIGAVRNASGSGLGDIVFLNRNAADTSTVTASDEKMRITYTGNVGIGTTGPTQKLQVVGGDILFGTTAMLVGNTSTLTDLKVDGNLEIGGTIFGTVSGTFVGNLPFNQITSGLNTGTTMVVGNGSSLTATGTGVINATQLQGIGSSGFVQNQFALSQTASFRISGNGMVAGKFGVGNTGTSTFNVIGNGNITTSLNVGTSINAAQLNIGGTNVITTTKLFLAANGSVTTPSYAFISDTNTGLYLPSADVIGIGTSGIERVRIAADGSVGIGISVPLSTLHLRGASGSTTALTFTSFAENGASNQNAKITYSGSGNNSLDIATGYNSDANKITLSPKGVTAMTILGSGNVGINNTNPVQKLDVTGWGNFSSGIGIGTTDSAYSFHTSTNGRFDTNLSVGGTLTLAQGAQAGYILKSDASGNASWVSAVGIGGTYTASNGLTVVGSDFRLGGLLTQNTDIGLSGFTLNISDTGSTLVSFSPTSTTFNTPTNFTSSGDVSVAYDLYFTNSTASYIKAQGPMYIQTESPFANLDLNLSAANAGQIYLNSDAQLTKNLTIGGTFLSVGSTNVVTNLDADYLDGLHANSFIGVGQTANFITSLSGGTDISITGAGIGRTINDTSTLATVTGRGASTATTLSLTGGAYFGSTSQSLLKSNGNISIGTTLNSQRLTIAGDLSSNISYSYLSTGNVLLSNLEGGAYFGKVGIKENQWLLNNFGATWAQKDSPRSWWGIAMSSDGRIQSATVQGSGNIYISSDYGNTWAAKGSSLSWRNVAMSADGKIQTATADSANIYISSDYGNTWAAKDSSRDWLNIAMSSDGKIQAATQTSGNIWVSTDFGNTWTQKAAVRAWKGIAMSSDGKIMIAANQGGNLYVSTDYGNNWTAKDSARQWQGVAMSADGKIQTAGVQNGFVYTSGDYGNTWAQRATSQNWYNFAMSADGRIQTGVVLTGNDYVSTDYGITWTAKDIVRDWLNIAMSSDGKIQAGVTNGSYLYVSTADSYVNAGSIGIGISSPAEKLHVAGNIRADSAYPYFDLYSTTWANHSYIQNNVSQTGVGNGNYLTFLNPANKGFAFTEGATNALTIDTAGLVGIGISTPTKPLQVVGSNNVEAPLISKILSVADSSDSTKSISLGYSPTGDIGLIYGIDDGTSWKNIAINPFGGNVGIGLTNPAVKLHVIGTASGTVARFTDNTNGTLDIRFPVANVSDIYANSTDMSLTNQSGEVVRLKAGNVGIGTTNPTSKLHVVGNGNITGNLTIGTSFVSVGSTNIVTNLDADLLDGYHATSFLGLGGTGSMAYVNNTANSTLTRAGAGPYTLALNLGSTNTWVADQTFANINLTGNLSVGSTIRLTSAGNLSNIGTYNGYVPAQSATSTNSVYSFDSRNTNYNPQDRNAGLYVDFKANATDGLADGGTYHGSLTFRSYGAAGDLSGGNPMQLSYTENGGLFTRLGVGITNWGGWRQLAVNNMSNNFGFMGSLGIGTTGPLGPMHIKIGATEAFFVKSNGNVGMGTTNPGAKLDIAGATSNISNTSGDITIDSASNNISFAGDKLTNLSDITDAALAGAGNRAVYSDATGKLTNTASDARLKVNVTTLTQRLDVIAALSHLRGVYYNWDTSNPAVASLGNQTEIGMIAQEVESVMPELVGTNATGYKSLDYSKMTGFLVEVAKIQQAALTSLNTDLTLTQTGQVNINYNVSEDVLNSLGYSGTKNELESAHYSITDSMGKTISRISQFGQIAAAKINAGLISATSIVTDKFVANTAIANKLKVDVISPLSDTVHVEGNLAVNQNVTAQKVQSNAVNTDYLEAKNAVVSTLYTDNVITKDGSFTDLMTNKIASLRTEMQKLVSDSMATPASQQLDATASALLAESQNWGFEVSTNSAKLNGSLSLTDNLVIGSQLMVQGYTQLASTFIKGTLLVDSMQMYDNTIEGAYAGLQIQPSGFGSVNIMNNLFIAQNGEIEINGNLKINGNLTASEATVSGSLIANLLNAQNATISGTLAANNIETNTIKVATDSASSLIVAESGFAALATSSAQINSNATAGSSTLPAGKTEIIVHNNKLTAQSMVYLTPVGSTQNQVPYLKAKFISPTPTPDEATASATKESTFTIALDKPLDNNIDINWWIIN